MNSRGFIVSGGLAVWLALAGPASARPPAPAAPPGDLGEMRDWLSQRNQERKKLGLPGAGFADKSHAARPRPPAPVGVGGFAQSRSAPSAEIGRGPDGRIHHRLLLNEEGPDQLQVYTPSGYAPQSAEEAAKLGRLTERGRRSWESGSSLRDPASYLSFKKGGQGGGR